MRHCRENPQKLTRSWPGVGMDGDSEFPCSEEGPRVPEAARDLEKSRVSLRARSRAALCTVLIPKGPGK